MPLFLLGLLLLPSSLRAQFPGGFVEASDSAAVRPAMAAAQIRALLPSRGPFRFPAPYGTEGVRLTNAADCGGADCVDHVGYTYWRNTNNHVGSDTMLVFLGLDRARGGGGPTLLRYNKVTDEVAVIGPLFDPSTSYSWNSGEGWYFSATRPSTLYLHDGSALRRYDVLTHAMSTVFDVRQTFGEGKSVWQAHSSDDDRVHSATLAVRGETQQSLGCLVYIEDRQQFSYFPRTGDFDECQIDKSGRWLLIKEQVDGLQGDDNVVVDLQTGIQRVLLDEDGAGGHSDNGYGYTVAADNWNREPNAFRLWKFGDDPLRGSLVYRGTSWFVDAPGHVSHANARPGAPAEEQYVCGAGANAAAASRANEVVCFRLDGSGHVLVVAPVMTDLQAAGGGDDYSKAPMGNLDVTGQYFIWTSNMGGPRLDAFIVKIPAQLLPMAAHPTARVMHAGPPRGRS